ncbi:alpha-amylase family glycosyl hydrolase [Clostridium fungisolvens]|uniref:Alpha-1,4-glucan:maltose-1-phosphate maltosyltransferase n=1 Tax=Clostridium fungisolvens TaxID=1604897 RepID=A0A6V8SSU7_9CLOT|nr:alpha-amylase family glycosyl hydrolase [Clostridium fungisolvens]GFP77973.1 Alpha-1,4-glucan:maltose-1-phosphate maltosyltransferase [Clostridium fungisolvens]
MAKDTKKNLRNKIIYSVFVRNHGKNGTFKDVEDDLKRIKELGTDIVWFMPIHPIGEKNRKGSLGSPYAIKDYRGINSEYGTLEDFKRLIDKIHSLDMLCMIDVVYNHTSPDSWLVDNHPEYFYRKQNGEMGNKVGDWTDIVDLDYNNKDLWNYQIETLKYWASIGVDGFRCDVAPLVPLDFWLSARQAVAQVNPDHIWLSETVHPHFLLEMRKNGFVGLSDSEIYQAFDITYDYDVNVEYTGYFANKNSLRDYINKVKMQEGMYPDNYVKLRFLENHDQPRAKSLIPDEEALKIWTGFLYFQKGTTLIYAGQEAQDDKCPSLFELDKIQFGIRNNEYVDLMKRLGEIKRKEILAEGFYSLECLEKDVLYGCYEYNRSKLIGIFNVEKKEGCIVIPLTDGIYTNIIDDSVITVSNGTVELVNKPIIIEVTL